MAYTCEICTDYIDPSKREEILWNVEKIITRSYLRRQAEEMGEVSRLEEKERE